MLGRRQDDSGAVAAEFAVVLPAVVLVLVLAVGALMASGRHIRLEHGVAQAARLAARGESPERVQDAVAQAVPGAAVTIGGSGDLFCVTATVGAGLALPVPDLQASSCAVGEAR